MTSNRRTGFKAAILAGCACLALLPVEAVAQARADTRFAIPAQDLGSALTQLGRDSGREIIFSADLVRGLRVPAVTLSGDVERVLTALLRGTGLTWRRNAAGTLIVERGPERGGPEPVSEVDEIVVTGSRARPRVATETSAPVDSFSAEALVGSGYPDLNNSLLALEPSLNFGNSVYGGAATNARGASLRGLGQDQVLVLIDGKRRHASASINFNNTLGRGEVPVDFGLIPVSAIERVEVLRDGAGAQYGSDAIAGVINVILRKDDRGGQLAAQAGQTEEGDGLYAILAGRSSFDLAGGSLTLSGEYQERDSVNRARVDSRFGRVTNQQGELDSTHLNLGLAGEWPVGPSTQVYGNALYARRDSQGAVRFRVPTTAPAFFPDGFLPLVAVEIDDIAGTVGARGDWRGWRLDLSETYGRNTTDFRGEDTVNVSLGAASPTSFDGGSAEYSQNVVDATAQRGLAVLSGLDLAVGAAHRFETYDIRRGEPASFTGAGASGAAGLNPSSPVDVSREAVSIFAEGELSLLPNVRLGAAVRHEEYDDFGGYTTGKVSAFFRPSERVAVRATASTGIRAPSLQQSFFSSVTSQAVLGVIESTGTFAATDPVARAVGGAALEPETSENISGGLVWTPFDALTVTADVYRIDIDGRISLSESLPRSNAAVGASLRAAGITNIQSVRFFTNAVNTRTEGYEIVANWDHRFNSGTTLDLSLAYSAADTDIVTLRANPVVPTLPLLATNSLNFLLKAKPRNRTSVSAAWRGGRLDLSLTANHFGEYRAPSHTTTQQFDAVTNVDANGRLRLTDAVTLGFGVLNLTDAYPEELIDTPAVEGGGLAYGESGSVGLRGREYYARLTWDF